MIARDEIAGLLDGRMIAAAHDRLTIVWHQPGPAQDGVPASAADASLSEVIADQHRANFDLWHLEDRARDPQSSSEEIAGVKGAIDQTNQRRNDLLERADGLLLAALTPFELPVEAAELHSETPAMIVDRLSILALKLFHTREEIDRTNAPEGHARRNRERLAVLEVQRADLAGCLDRLWGQVLSGERRFKLYRQLKMYNDPSLNPVVYGRHTGM
jgi:hypothetical protein